MVDGQSFSTFSTAPRIAPPVRSFAWIVPLAPISTAVGNFFKPYAERTRSSCGPSRDCGHASFSVPDLANECSHERARSARCRDALESTRRCGSMRLRRPWRSRPGSNGMSSRSIRPARRPDAATRRRDCVDRPCGRLNEAVVADDRRIPAYEVTSAPGGLLIDSGAGSPAIKRTGQSPRSCGPRPGL
jgi:hypothetical protein